MNIIVEDFTKSWVTPSEYDYLLAHGWRHFGDNFFRYNINMHDNAICNVIPLRVKLQDFIYSKSQKKIQKKCSEFTISIDNVCIDNVTHSLFEKHKKKFIDNTPSSIYDFLSSKNVSNVPTQIKEVRVFDSETLIAISYFAIGENSISSIYGMFDTDYNRYSLGLFTMFIEIEFAKTQDLLYYYHGYCYDVSSFYDYKKKFRAVQSYQWDTKKWSNIIK
ncbi:GNAT family protein [Flammeovirga kamogawensis]|uniref:Arginine-tRNA-protein transferase n=1 Tax=Flammeovirga kamogawensis TaxID=373891 RepID=A0ABX8GXN7_9BACT|nr:arginine-tRNA-protein transferase [Flammeovirga kamogawensis]MBB6460605.1 arginine-tRNA-protein transferase [Flammeovirga kamogawensis]QWG07962.1 arginine-tRNA-protein transferase [Flammeovirga kamogawensis]TRX69770.1 arginine-tRNA-protein transferase [Flammeovirga kamogawensis]